MVGADLALAGDTDHTIIVDGLPYPSYQESGDTWHFLSPGPTATSASVPERGQVWNGINGANFLPCDGNIHWVSNQNLLTISACIHPVPTTTTSTSTTSTTSTS